MPFLDPRRMRAFSPHQPRKLNLFETPQMFCDLYCLEAGQEQAPHRHARATKFYFVLEGRGRFRSGDEERELEAGELAWAPPDELHGVANPGPQRLVLLVSMAPNPNAERARAAD